MKDYVYLRVVARPLPSSLDRNFRLRRFHTRPAPVGSLEGKDVDVHPYCSFRREGLNLPFTFETEYPPRFTDGTHARELSNLNTQN